MKHIVAATLLFFVGLLSVVPDAHAGTFKRALENGVEGQYIVVLKADAARLKHQTRSPQETVSVVAQRLAKAYQGDMLEIFENALPAFVITLSERQAKRLARWRVRREAAKAPKFKSPLRPGQPPGHRKKPIHEVDNVLTECHWLAWEVMRLDSS